MYAFIANGYKGIIESKQTLYIMSSIFPYPKFRKVHSLEEGIKFLERYDRGIIEPRFKNYGDTDKDFGYVTIEYFIDENDLYVTIDTTKVGFIKVSVNTPNDVAVDNRPTTIRIRISNIRLNNDLISDHCVAIQNILELLGDFVDVNLIVPDISIYLALTKYTGDSYVIRDCKEIIERRLGGVSYTIR